MGTHNRVVVEEIWILQPCKKCFTTVQQFLQISQFVWEMRVMRNFEVLNIFYGR